MAVVVLHLSHMMDLFLDRRTGESLAVTSSPFVLSAFLVGIIKEVS